MLTLFKVDLFDNVTRSLVTRRNRLESARNGRGVALPGPAPFGPLYYPSPFPPPPPKAQNPAALIVLVVVVVFLIVSALGAILYVMVAGLIRVPNPPPLVLLGPAELNLGNATLQVTSSARLDPSSLRLGLQANGSASPEFGMPAPYGSAWAVAGGHTLRVFWLDVNNDSLLSTGDAFWVTGNLAPLPDRTSFSLTLRSPRGQFFAESGWTTP